jgi:hypothetical protein
MAEIATTSLLDLVFFQKPFLIKLPRKCSITEDLAKVSWNSPTDKMSSDTSLTKLRMKLESS